MLVRQLLKRRYFFICSLLIISSRLAFTLLFSICLHENFKIRSVKQLKGDNKYTYSIFMNDDSSLSTGEFSFSVNDSKTKYTVNVYYKKTKDNNVLTESNFDIKYTSKRAGNFKESEVIDNIENNEMTELEKFDFYSKVLTDSNFSKFLPIFEKMV